MSPSVCSPEASPCWDGWRRGVQERRKLAATQTTKLLSFYCEMWKKKKQKPTTGMWLSSDVSQQQKVPPKIWPSKVLSLTHCGHGKRMWFRCTSLTESFVLLSWLCLTLFTLENRCWSQITEACRLLKEISLLIFAASEELCPLDSASHLCVSYCEDVEYK